jgi:dihydroorotate dehydrogenase electron transfer subunit
VRSVEARVFEITLDASGSLAAWIACPASAVPAPGRYSLAAPTGDPEAVLPVTLFASQVSEQGFLAAPPLPAAWVPGLSLRLRGPLGKGFSLPGSVRRLALAACGGSNARLASLAQQAAAAGADIAWFTDAPLPPVPASYEINPLRLLPDALAWADFLALDAPLPRLAELRGLLGLRPDQHLPCLAQVLVETPMPCGGVAECGVCAVPARRGWKLACQDGPVFNLDELEW